MKNDSSIIELIIPEGEGDWCFVKTLYEDLFPSNERRAFHLLKEIHHSDRPFTVFLIHKEERLVGFITVWRFSDFLYCEHFAVDQSESGQGIGSLVLQKLISLYALPLYLEVEMPVEEMAKRRVGFYQRNGFELLDVPYLQPPYSEEFEPVEMKLMVHPNGQSKVSVDQVMRTLYTHVYEVKQIG